MPKTGQYSFVKVDEMPAWKDIPEGIVYWAEQYHGLGFKCPCGCGEDIYLGISETVANHPHLWNFDGKSTIIPSIQRTSGCRSHFHITNGLVVW